MATIESLGTKRVCPSCSARFYDLNKRPAQCPKCAQSFDPTVQPRARRKSRSTVSEAHDSEDLLLQHMKSAPGKARPKAKKEGEDELEDFGEIAAGGDDDIAEIEAIDDLEALEQIEEIDAVENEEEGEMTLDENGAALIDTITDEPEEEEAGDDESPKKGAAKKPSKR